MCIISIIQTCRHRSAPQADWKGRDHSGLRAMCPTFLRPVSPFPFLRSMCDKPLLYSSVLSSNWKRPNHHPPLAVPSVTRVYQTPAFSIS